MTLPGFAVASAARIRSDEVDDRRTPRAFFDRLNRARGFTIDAAANPENALLPVYWTIADDGLWQSWRHHRIWCNPPYANIQPWVVKAWDEMLYGGCDSVDMLVPADRTEQSWWQTYVEPWRDSAPRRCVSLGTKFLPGRMQFSNADGLINGHTPFGSALLQWSRA